MGVTRKIRGKGEVKTRRVQRGGALPNTTLGYYSWPPGSLGPGGSLNVLIGTNGWVGPDSIAFMLYTDTSTPELSTVIANVASDFGAYNPTGAVYNLTKNSTPITVYSGRIANTYYRWVIGGLTPGTLYAITQLKPANASGTVTIPCEIYVRTLPPAVTTPTASNVTATGFTLKWYGGQGATAFYVVYTTTLTATGAAVTTVTVPTAVTWFGTITGDAVNGYTAISSVGFPSQTVSLGIVPINLAANGTVQKPDASDPSAVINRVLITFPPTKPVISITTYATSTSIIVNWTAYGASLLTSISFKDSLTGNALTPSPAPGLTAGTATLTGLSLGTTYGVVITATVGGASADSAPMMINTAPKAPVVTVTNRTTTGFTLNWQDVGATVYAYQGVYSPNTTTTNLPTPIARTATSATFTGFVSDPTNVIVYAYAANNGINTTAGTSTTIPKVYLAPGTPFLWLNSTPVVTATTYKYQVTCPNAPVLANISVTGTAGTPVITGGGGTNTNYTLNFTGLTAGTNYSFTVTAGNYDNTATASATFTFSTPPTPITIAFVSDAITGTPFTQGAYSATFSFTGGQGATSYTVANNGTTLPDSSVNRTGNTFTVSGLFLSNSITLSGLSPPNAPVVSNAVVYIPTPPRPSIASYTVSGTTALIKATDIPFNDFVYSITISFTLTNTATAVSTTTASRTYACWAGGISTSSALVTGNAIVDQTYTMNNFTGLTLATNYTVTINVAYAYAFDYTIFSNGVYKQNNKAPVSSPTITSAPFAFTSAPLPPIAPTAPIVSNIKNDGFTLSWTGDTTTTTYAYYLAALILVTGSAAEQTAVGTAVGDFTRNGVLSSTTVLSAQNYLTITASGQTSPIVPFSSTAPAFLPSSTTNNPTTFNSLQPNTVYVVKISVGNLGGSNSRIVIGVTGPPLPTFGTLTTTSPVGVASNSCTLSITPGTGTTGFSYTIDGNAVTPTETKTMASAFIPSTNYSYSLVSCYKTLTASFTGIPPGSHTLVATAIFPNGSIPSTPYTMIFAPDIPVLSSSNVTYNQFTVTWTGGTGATSYTYSVNGATVTPNSTATNSATFTGLAATTAYTITVTATNSSGSSPVSSPLTITTLVAPPAAPVLLPFTNITSSRFTVSWSGAAGATSYSYLVNGVAATPVSTTANSVTFAGYSPAAVLPVIVTAINASGTTPSAAATVTLLTLEQQVALTAVQTASSAVQQTVSSAMQQTASSATQQTASSATQQQASSATQQQASSAVQQAASSAQWQQASSALQQRASSATQQQASSAVQQQASSAVQQAASSAQWQQASSALQQRASSATQQQASSATQQGASSALQQQASSATQQGVSSAVQQQASSALQQRDSSAVQQQASSAVQQQASSAVQQGVSSARQQQASSALQQRDSSAVQQQASSAVQQQASSATQQQASSATQQQASSALQQRDSSAVQQQASSATQQGVSSAIQQQASSAVQQRYSSAVQQQASSATQQQASSAVQQQASSATQQGVSSAVQQQASSALQQRASSAIQQQASSAIQQGASSALQQQASSALQQQASSALQQRASSAIQQQASSAVQQQASSAVQQQASSAVQQRYSSAVQQQASSAVQQQASSAVQQQASSATQQGVSSAVQQQASSALQQRDSSAVQQQASSAVQQQASSAVQQQASSAVQQQSSSAVQQQASSALQQRDSSATQQGVSSALQQQASSATQQGVSSARQQQASSALQQRDSSATQQQASSATQQGVSSAIQQQASSAVQQRYSSAVQQQASSATQQQASSATQQNVSSAVQQQASSATQQQASSATQQQASSAVQQQASSATQQQASSATQQRYSSAVQQRDSSAVQQQASSAVQQQSSSAVQQQASSAVQQRYSSAVQQQASSATQQQASSATQQQASSAVQQQASSALQQQASSAVQQQSSSAVQQQASSAVQQESSSAVQQEASSAVQQQTSSAVQQQASSAVQQRESSATQQVLSGQLSIHQKLIDDLKILKQESIAINRTLYSSTSQAERAAVIQQLQAKVREILAKQTEIFAEDEKIRAINAKYEDRDMQTVIPDANLERLGYKKWYDIETNTHFYTDLNDVTVDTSTVLLAVSTATGTQHGGKKYGKKTRRVQRGGAITFGTLVDPTISKPTVSVSLNRDMSILMRITTPDVNPLFGFVINLAATITGATLQNNRAYAPWNTELSPTPIAATDGLGGYVTTIPANSIYVVPSNMTTLYIFQYTVTGTTGQKGAAATQLLVRPVKPTVVQDTCSANSTSITINAQTQSLTAKITVMPAPTLTSSLGLKYTATWSSLAPGSTITAILTEKISVGSSYLSIDSDPFIAVTTPAMIPITVTAITNSSITITWTGIAGITYTPYISAVANTNPTGGTMTGTGTLTYTQTGLAANTPHYPVVNAANSCGSSGASLANFTFAPGVPKPTTNPTANTVMTLPAAPTAITVTVNTLTATGCGITFSGGVGTPSVWLPVNFSYTLNGGSQITAPAPTTSNGVIPGITLTTLTPGENNNLIVTLTNAGGSTSATKVITTPPVQPTSLSTTAVTDKAFTLNWTDTNGSATTYIFTIGGVATTPSSTTAKSATFTGLTATTSYSIIVTATANGTSVSSAAFVATTAAAVPTNWATSDNTSNGFTATWVGSPGTYTFKYSACSPDPTGQGAGVCSTTFTPIVPSSISGTTATFNTLQPNTCYQIMVTCTSTGTNPVASQPATFNASTGPPLPVIENFVNTNPGTTGTLLNNFTIDISANYVGTSDPYANTGREGTVPYIQVLTTGAISYSYTIDGIDVFPVNEASVPWFINAFMPVQAGYNNYRSRGQRGKITAEFAGVSPGSHTLVVKAMSLVGQSSTPFTILFAPEQPVVNAVSSSISYDRFTISWSGGTGATNYTYSVDTVSPPVTTRTPSAIASKSATFNGLSGSTTYYVSILAYNSAGSSPISAVISITTSLGPPAPPVLLPFTNITGSGFTVAWSGAAGATTYSYLVNGVAATPVSTTANSVTFAGYSPGAVLPVIVNAINSIGTTPSASATVTLISLAQLQASSAVQQGVSSAAQQVASSAMQQVASSAMQWQASSAMQQQASSAVQQGVSSAAQQQASSALQQQASSAMQQGASSATREQASSAVQQGVSSAAQQVASSAMQQVASSAMQWQASSAMQQQASSAVQQTASSAVQQVASSAMQQQASSATREQASSATRQQASSAVQQQASSAVQQVASSAMQQQASSAMQQQASSAVQQQASSAVQQTASSAVQQVASSAMQQVASSATREQASSATRQQASSAVQQVASSAVQQLASSAMQQQASSAEERRYKASGATRFKMTLFDELRILRIRVSEILTILYSPQTQYPATTTDGTFITDFKTGVKELTSAFAAFSNKQTEIINMDNFIYQLDSTFEDKEMQPVVQDSSLTALGYTKRFDIASNKYIFFDSTGMRVPSPI